MDLDRALQGPTGPENVVLLPGDSIFIPEFNPVGLIRDLAQIAGALTTVLLLVRQVR